ncbi:hypothetical protein IMCC1989_223 [gamma proteobacterium IMCC1989]|nr:hypothetical protein IMCC1989_223 [gamma proteobacterium IMCC1989]
MIKISDEKENILLQQKSKAELRHTFIFAKKYEILSNDTKSKKCILKEFFLA